MRTRLIAAMLFVLAGSCATPQAPAPVPAPAPAPQPAPAPAPTPTPAPAPVQPLPPASAGWIDMPQSAGDWFYASRPPFTYAAFGASETSFDFVLRCDRANRTVNLGRVSAAAGERAVRISTETVTRQFTGVPRQGSIEQLIAVDLAASDPLLDAMAISRGRFAVEVAGEPALYIPSWPEVTRLIEDCR